MDPHHAGASLLRGLQSWSGGRQTCTCWIFSFFARHSLPLIIHVRTVSLLASIPCLLPRYSAAKVGPNPSYTRADQIFTACFSIFSSIRRFDGFPRSPWTTALSPRPCRNLARRLGGHAWSSLPLPGLRATCVDGRFRADRQVDAYFSVLCVFQFACSHAVPSCVSTGALSYVPLNIQDFPY
jgi:hypothetical protein